VDEETFDRMIREGAFLEWAEVHEHRYGSSLENLRSGEKTQSLLFEVDWKGASHVRREIKEAVLIFVMTPSLDDLIRRIKGRGPISPEELSVRIRTATLEIQKVADFDYLVINDSFDIALNELQSIITVESCKGRHRIPAWTERWAKEIQAHEKVKGQR
jgi:guanylate kinase